MPIFAAFMMLFAMANRSAGHQRFCRRVHGDHGRRAGQLLVAAAAATTLIFGRLTPVDVQAGDFGDVGNSHVAEMEDVNKREFLVLAILAVVVLGMGLLPDLFVSKMHLLGQRSDRPCGAQQTAIRG